MVTSTLTPGSILMEVICLTISEGLCRSMSRMWILIWNRSQISEPSPQGVSLVVILRVLVGIRTGPLALRFFSFAPLIRSAHTFSRDFTLWLMRVILIRWMATSGSTGVLLVSFFFSQENNLFIYLFIYFEDPSFISLYFLFFLILFLNFTILY